MDASWYTSVTTVLSKSLKGPTGAGPAGKVEERGESKGLEDEERILLARQWLRVSREYD